MMRMSATAVLSLLFFCVALTPTPAWEQGNPGVLDAATFGAIGDGRVDDGPAIQRAVASLRRQKQPAVLRFEAGKSYRVEKVADVRLFRLEGCRDITIDGRGATFVLGSDVRMMLIEGCSNVHVRNLSVDYDPLPFVDGLIVNKNASEQYVDVRVFDEFVMPPAGGPTREGGEQAYFAMLWIAGTHGPIGHHFYVLDMQPLRTVGEEGRVVRVFTDFEQFDKIRENVHTISLPVRGVAHRHLDGATIRIAASEDVRIEGVNVWSAPWFAFQVMGNRGSVIFRHVDIRPKPDSNRRTSSWRDGFHVKGNRASLLFEACHIEGTNDDAMNISTHMSRVIRVVSPIEIHVQQVYPLQFVPFETNDSVTVFRMEEQQIVATTRLIGCQELPTHTPAGGRQWAPAIALRLAEPVDGLAVGDRLWSNDSANPETVVRRCKIYGSCRFQSPLTIEECQLGAFCWFHGENIEGPIPSRVVIRDSTIKLGRGNATMAAKFDGTLRSPSATHRDDTTAMPGHAAIQHVLLQGNTIDGQVHFERVKHVELHGNRFLPPRSTMRFADCEDVLLADNFLHAERIDDVSQVITADQATREAITIENSNGP